MEKYYHDTIAAIATAPGVGGIAMVRMSGEGAGEIFKQVFFPKKKQNKFTSHQMMVGHIRNEKETLDEVMAVYMAAPRTYTREDVVEIYSHGGSVMAGEILALLLQRGAVLAQPGEFTKRAFLNGRIDLSQAEAVMDVISASGKKAAQVAMRQLSGGASSFIQKAQEQLYQLAAGLEAAIDYPEEVEEEEATRHLEQGMLHLAQELIEACNMQASKLLKEGLMVAICGKPNVGKSSLLNALTKEEHAIVTDVPGTTRDIISATLELEGVYVRLYDTAGLRESEDRVESIGIKKAKKVMEEADLLLLVIDASQPFSKEDEALLLEYQKRDVGVILHKGDLALLVDEQIIKAIAPRALVRRASSKTGEGLTQVRRLLKEKAMVPSQITLTNQRHMDAATRAAQHLLQGAKTLQSHAPLDMVAVDLQAANSILGEITGEDVSERVLDAVFANFCVGK